MSRCLVTYSACKERYYSKEGLKQISKRLSVLKPFPYSKEEQLELAAKYAEKLSIQGVQPKLTVNLHPSTGEWQVVERGGRYLLKPPHPSFRELPENEDLTMHLANSVGIEVPFHTLIVNQDGSFSYLIQRFDREPKGRKFSVEDFAQLMELDRETKYDSSVEQIIAALQRFCTFPQIEGVKLFRRLLFSFLVGNEDMHIKNYSVITKKGLVSLSPAYDLLNSSIVLSPKEESALPIKGKKSRLTPSLFFDYLAKERLALTDVVIEKERDNFLKAIPHWEKWIEASFLSLQMKKRYADLVKERVHRIFS